MKKTVLMLMLMTIATDYFKSDKLDIKSMIPKLKVLREMYKNKPPDTKQVKERFDNWKKGLTPTDKGKFLKIKKNIEENYYALQGGGRKRKTRKIVKRR